MVAPTPTARLVSNANIPSCFYDETAQPKTLKNGITVDPKKPDTLHITFDDTGIAFEISYDQNGMRFSNSQEYFFTLNPSTNTEGKSILSTCDSNSPERNAEFSALLLYFPKQSFSVVVESVF